jgi:hypothetical protein
MANFTKTFGYARIVVTNSEKKSTTVVYPSPRSF